MRRFVDLATEGVDLHGEARFLDALIAPGSHVLDAGCGTGRVGAELARRGHRVLAVDADPVLVTGFATDREYGLDRFDADTAAVGLVCEHRFATWDLGPWRPSAQWAVRVLRRR